MPGNLKVTPCLPSALLESFKHDSLVDAQSIIYDEAFHDFRCRVLKAETEERLSVLCEKPAAVYSGRMGTVVGTYLHLAIVSGDIPLAYECIRLGVPLDAGHVGSEPPLVLATRFLADAHLCRRPTTVVGRERARKKHDRLVRITTLMVEQHVEPNLVRDNGQPAVVHACHAFEFDLVKLLLEHDSAPVSLSLENWMRKDEDMKRLLSVIENTKPLSPRPPQPCPCFSGKLLSECHAQRQAYPDGFICFCSSRKLFGRCCKKRDFQTYEVWDTGLRSIRAFNEQEAGMAKILEVLPESLRPMAEEIARQSLNGKIPSKFILPEARQLITASGTIHADFLLSKKKIDPAFAYALKQIDFRPIVLDRSQSKVESQERMNIWNDAVDRYIASGVDERPIREIEIRAKLGPDGGALYRRCEGEGCTVVEHVDVEKLKMCGACKAAYYCSMECQRAHWKGHKSKCKSATHTAQLLPSQVPYTELLHALHGTGGGADFLVRWTLGKGADRESLLQEEAQRIPEYFVVRVAEIRAMTQAWK